MRFNDEKIASIEEPWDHSEKIHGFFEGLDSDAMEELMQSVPNVVEKCDTC